MNNKIKKILVSAYVEDNEYIDSIAHHRGFKAEFIRRAINEAVRKHKLKVKKEGK
jgi:hypothetical protein